jgi:hypothetical protein
MTQMLESLDTGLFLTVFSASFWALLTKQSKAKQSRFPCVEVINFSTDNS